MSHISYCSWILTSTVSLVAPIKSLSTVETGTKVSAFPKWVYRQFQISCRLRWVNSGQLSPLGRLALFPENLKLLPSIASTLLESFGVHILDKSSHYPVADTGLCVHMPNRETSWTYTHPSYGNGEAMAGAFAQAEVCHPRVESGY
jgi:hypothetical protein